MCFEMRHSRASSRSLQSVFWLGAVMLLPGSVIANEPASWPTDKALPAFTGEVEKLVGVWAEDCSLDTGGQYVDVINRTHVLSFFDDGSGRSISFQPITESWIGQSEGERRVEDGILYFQPIDSETGERGTERVDGEQCERLPASLSLLHGEATSLLLAMPRIQTACARSKTACAEKMLATGDVAATGGLNEADLSRLIRIATYIGTARRDAEGDEILGGQALSLGFAPLLADMVLRSFDYNGDSQLSMTEMATDRSLLDAGSLSMAEDSTSAIQQDVQESLQQLQGLFRMLQ